MTTRNMDALDVAFAMAGAEDAAKGIKPDDPDARLSSYYIGHNTVSLVSMIEDVMTSVQSK